jgi:hypothetical protein
LLYDPLLKIQENPEKNRLIGEERLKVPLVGCRLKKQYEVTVGTVHSNMLNICI